MTLNLLILLTASLILAQSLLWTPALYAILGGVSAQALIAGQQLLLHRDAWLPLYGARAYGSFFPPSPDNREGA